MAWPPKTAALSRRSSCHRPASHADWPRPPSPTAIVESSKVPPPSGTRGLPSQRLENRDACVPRSAWLRIPQLQTPPLSQAPRRPTQALHLATTVVPLGHRIFPSQDQG